MGALEKIQHDMKIVRLVEDVKKPLPTTFRVSHSFTMPVELAVLFKQLRSEHNINVSAKAEPVLKKLAIKLAREVNQNLSECARNQQESVDSQPHSGK